MDRLVLVCWVAGKLVLAGERLLKAPLCKGSWRPQGRLRGWRLDGFAR